MRRLRSEDSATGKTECDRIELRRHALGMTEPHGDALAHGKRDAPQASDDLRRLEEEAWRLHWYCPVRRQINERRKARQGYGLYPTRYDDRGLAGDGLHGRNGALADQCDGHRVGTHAVECDAAGGVGALKMVGSLA